MSRLFSRAGRRFVVALDAVLRRVMGIFEFSDEPACLLRLALGHSVTEIVLSDGTHIYPGDPVGELHLWNEHIPRMGAQGPDMHWAAQFYRGMLNSLKSLSTYIQTDARFQQVGAFWAEVAVFQWEDIPALARVFAQLGFEIQYPPARNRWWERVQLFTKNLYTWGLMWAFQPASLRRKAFGRTARFGVWISRAELLARYGEDQ